MLGNALGAKQLIGIIHMFGTKRIPKNNTYYSKNKESKKAYSRAYYIKNKQKHKIAVSRFHKNNPWFRTWTNVQQRCNYKKDKKYKHYGGRGIKCLLKKDDIKFLWERDKASKMKRPSIDRIDNNGHYELDNCQFIEMSSNIMKSWHCRWGIGHMNHEKIYTERMEIKLSKDQRKRIEKMATKKGWTLNQLIRNAIDEITK